MREGFLKHMIEEWKNERIWALCKQLNEGRAKKEAGGGNWKHSNPSNKRKKKTDTIRQKSICNNREDMLSDIFCIFMVFYQKQA